MKLNKIDRHNYTKGTKISSWPLIAAACGCALQIGIGGLLL